MLFLRQRSFPFYVSMNPEVLGLRQAENYTMVHWCTTNIMSIVLWNFIIPFEFSGTNAMDDQGSSGRIQNIKLSQRSQTFRSSARRRKRTNELLSTGGGVSIVVCYNDNFIHFTFSITLGLNYSEWHFTNCSQLQFVKPIFTSTLWLALFWQFPTMFVCTMPHKHCHISCGAGEIFRSRSRSHWPRPNWVSQRRPSTQRW